MEHFPFLSNLQQDRWVRERGAWKSKSKSGTANFGQSVQLKLKMFSLITYTTGTID